MPQRIRVPLAIAAVLAVAVVAAVAESPGDTDGDGPCITEFGGISGFPGGLAASDDGRLWFTEQVDERIGFLDSESGEITEISTPPGTQPHFMTIGHDGNPWFTALNDRVGTYDPDRERFRFFSDGITPGSVPHAILAHPDGNFYFTQQEGGRLARLDPRSGQIMEFSRGLPPLNRMHGITLDPDERHVWVALQGRDRLVRFDPVDERFDRFVATSDGSGPHDVKLSPDKRTLFVTLQYSSELGALDLDTGDYAEFETGFPPQPTPSDLEVAPKLTDVLASPKGDAMYITTFAADALLRFDLESHDVTRVTCGFSEGSGALEIVPGPQNKLWFTQVIGKRIARLDE